MSTLISLCKRCIDMEEVKSSIKKVEGQLRFLNSMGNDGIWVTQQVDELEQEKVRLNEILKGLLEWKCLCAYQLDLLSRVVIRD